MKHARAMRYAPGVCGLLVLMGVLLCCSSAAASSGGAAAREKVVASKSSGPVFTRTLRKGQSGTDIETLQAWLSAIGFTAPKSGYFGRMTKSAVRHFQLAHRLYPASGSVGNRTAATLLSAVSRVSKWKFSRPIFSAGRHRARLNPIPGFNIGRDDMGVDASARSGSGIYAPLASVLVQVLENWYAGQPLLLLRFVNQPAGALSNYWYVAEQISPVTTRVGTTFGAGQRVASFASRGTGIEIGWGSPTSNARTLAGVSDPRAAHPPSRSTTVWGESFKRFFGIG